MINVENNSNEIQSISHTMILDFYGLQYEIQFESIFLTVDNDPHSQIDIYFV